MAIWLGLYSAGSCCCLSRFSSMFLCCCSCIRQVARQRQHVYMFGLPWQPIGLGICDRKWSFVDPQRKEAWPLLLWMPLQPFCYISCLRALCAFGAVFWKWIYLFPLILIFFLLNCFLHASSSQMSPPLRWAGWVARLEGSSLNDILFYLLLLLSPSLHVGDVRTEVKSCRAELPGCLPKTVTDQKQFLHNSFFSVSVFSPTFSPLFWCAKCFSFFAPQRLFSPVLSSSPSLQYIKSYDNIFLLFCIRKHLCYFSFNFNPPPLSVSTPLSLVLSLFN